MAIDRKGEGRPDDDADRIAPTPQQFRLNPKQIVSIPPCHEVQLTLKAVSAGQQPGSFRRSRRYHKNVEEHSVATVWFTLELRPEPLPTAQPNAVARRSYLAGIQVALLPVRCLERDGFVQRFRSSRNPVPPERRLIQPCFTQGMLVSLVWSVAHKETPKAFAAAGHGADAQRCCYR
jgi:hypothetical protein